ncbi:MAG TPA: cytochrome P460 family protein [Verrucomicrobiae bacterium]|nr:cytochrome P460 family protein [Verrucomicrobiae bacterium]
MRAILLIPALALVCTAVAEVTNDGDNLLSLVEQRCDKLVRVTDQPRSMQPQVAAACAPGVIRQGPHDLAKCYHIYISKQGLDVLKNGKGIYPVGTVVLKEKFSDPSATNTELFTAMVKRDKGFNPASGDWEYFVLSGDAKKIEQRGKIESCMNCHDAYESTDFVTRDYMKNP